MDDKNYGVYGIYHLELLLYLGSTDCLNRRWNEHKRDLKKGKHNNKTLQKYIINNNINVDDLEFKVIHTPLDNSKFRLWVSEMICDYIFNPSCNKPLLQVGLKIMRFGKITVPFDKKILKYL